MSASRRAILGSTGALLAAMLFGCGGGQGPSGESETAAEPSPTRRADLEGTSLQIFHTNDVMGYVDPCG